MNRKAQQSAEKLSLFADPAKPLVATKTTTLQQTEQTNSGFHSTQDLLQNYAGKKTNKYISREFQDYACHLAEALNDPQHLSLYIKLAKDLPRPLLAKALTFVVDSEARNKAKLFMWKLQQLKQGKILSPSRTTATTTAGKKVKIGQVSLPLRGRSQLRRRNKAKR